MIDLDDYDWVSKYHFCPLCGAHAEAVEDDGEIIACCSNEDCEKNDPSNYLWRVT